MARNDGRLEPGQKLAGAISARAWNRAQDAADRVLGVGTGLMGEGATSASGASNIVLIRNRSGQPVPWLGVLGIDGVGFVDISPVGGNLTGNAPADQRARAFVAQPILSGLLPDSRNHTIAIAMEPIDVDKIGRVAIGGVFACRVHVTNETHKFATLRDNDVTQLRSAACGAVRLLWKPAGLGSNRWAVGTM